ncbi:MULTISPECIES: hypothetical protein [Anaeromyxobacter]|jgi:hypothetical protein|nr:MULTISPECIES: hypothetical protein [Anaeromyxobacter]ACG73615.1 conserved hypothetical protein [Anaeromyxobacter sp. K]ACL65814.1 conserved hypothetical protein [Anaeromyxobacter dehalogenans 2CP-1]GAO04061.1 hypothetical protein PSR1_02949 [Anaeromyxobacter sp. PSR-1]
MEEKLASLAPGRLAVIIEEGLRGHHVLFEPDQIRAAYAVPDEPVTREEADALGEALLTICRDPLPVARGAVGTLDEGTRLALIRLYFRLLDRAGEELRRMH